MVTLQAANYKNVRRTTGFCHSTVFIQNSQAFHLVSPIKTTKRTRHSGWKNTPYTKVIRFAILTGNTTLRPVLIYETDTRYAIYKFVSIRYGIYVLVEYFFAFFALLIEMKFFFFFDKNGRSSKWSMVYKKKKKERNAYIHVYTFSNSNKIGLYFTATVSVINVLPKLYRNHYYAMQSHFLQNCVALFDYRCNRTERSDNQRASGGTIGRHSDTILSLRSRRIDIVLLAMVFWGYGVLSVPARRRSSVQNL